MIKTSYQGIKALEDDYKEGRKQERSWRGVTRERMIEKVPESGIEGSSVLEGMFSQLLEFVTI